MSTDALYELWKKERVPCLTCKSSGSTTTFPIEGCKTCGGGGYTEDYLDWCARRHFDVNWDPEGGRFVNPDAMAAATIKDEGK